MAAPLFFRYESRRSHVEGKPARPGSRCGRFSPPEQVFVGEPGTLSVGSLARVRHPSARALFPSDTILPAMAAQEAHSFASPPFAGIAPEV